MNSFVKFAEGPTSPKIKRQSLVGMYRTIIVELIMKCF